MSAVISKCEQYRYRLDREVQPTGIVIAYFGINPSTADADAEDATTKRWRGFSLQFGARRYIAGNPFAYRATDVSRLARVADPVGPENHRHLGEIIDEADLLIPCWGNRGKVPRAIQGAFDSLLNRLRDSGKPVRVFGITNSGDPKHPLMLPYGLQLQEFDPKAKRQR